MKKLCFLGDVSLNGLISSEPTKNKKRFQKISNTLSQFETVFANLESPVHVENEINAVKQKYGVINTANNGVISDCLEGMNISVVSLANNHIFDSNLAGLIATEKLLYANSIKYIGASSDGVIKHFEYQLGNNDITIISYVHKQTNPYISIEHLSKVNLYDKEEILNEITKLKKQNKTVILSVHWGKDYSNFPFEQQITDYREFINCGCKIIVGHHSHTMQPYEKYKDGYIFYSLGQLCFGDTLWDNELRALKRKTKRAAFPVFDEELKLIKFITIKELKGNYIELTQWDYQLWSRIILFLYRLKKKSKFLSLIINLKETFFDRIVEYFFGYYRNPFKQLICFRNYYKISYLIRDYLKSGDNK